MTALTAVLYNGKRLIPAPEISFVKTVRRSADNSIIGAQYQAVITGTLVGCEGWNFSGATPEFYEGSDYPSSGTPDTCSKFTSIIKMQEKLRELFDDSNEYRWLEIVGCTGTSINKWRARTIDVNFPEGRWTDICPYTITLSLQTDNISNVDIYIDHTETWDVEFSEENGGIYTLRHTVSCQSEEFIDDNGETEGWKSAKSWIESRLATSGYSSEDPTSIKNLYIFDSSSDGVGFNLSDDYSAYNYKIQKSLDEYSGIYSIVEEWTLAKDPVFRSWEVSYAKNRSEDTTISIQGSFRSFLNRDSENSSPDNEDAALEAFNVWDANSGPYTEANSLYSSLDNTSGALGVCPVNKSVTINKESRGDGEETFGENVRIVNFSYEFSDKDSTAEVSITRTLNEQNFEKCEKRVTIQGNIQGHSCNDTTRLENAQAAFANLNIASLASDLYEGSGNLLRVSSNYSENEKDGVISFSYEYSDLFNSSGYVQDVIISSAWTCGDLGSDETSKTITTVSVTRRGLCSISIPSAPVSSTYSSYGTLIRSTINTDDTNHTVSAIFEYSSDGGAGLVEISVNKSVGPEDCSVVNSVVEIAIQGNGCSSSVMFANAQSLFTPLNPSSYAPSGSNKISYTEAINRTRGSIRASYVFSTEQTAITEVRITEIQDSQNCAYLSYSIDGEIKGRCFVSGGGMADAESAFENHGLSDYSEYGYPISSRITRNEKRNTISFAYEFKNIPSNYDHEQTIGIKTDASDGSIEVTISGNIVPFCDGENDIVTSGEEAWATIEGTLNALATEEAEDTVYLRNSLVSKNKKNGQVQYSNSYQVSSRCVSGAIRESISISHSAPVAVIAEVPIVGRTCGPYLQDKNTKTSEKCTISINLLFPRSDGCSYTKPSIELDPEEIIEAMGYCTEGGYVIRDEDDWNVSTSQYSRVYTKICICCN